MTTNPKDQMRPLEASSRMMQSLDALLDRARLMPHVNATHEHRETHKLLIDDIEHAIKMTQQLQDHYIAAVASSRPARREVA